MIERKEAQAAGRLEDAKALYASTYHLLGQAMLESVKLPDLSVERLDFYEIGDLYWPRRSR